MTVRPRYRSHSRFYRDAWLEIDLNAMEHNYRALRSLIPSATKLMAVVKSDAYGHGASEIAPILESLGCDYFGVASIDEGLQLREAGIKAEILILSPVPLWTFGQAIEHDLQLSLSSLLQFEELTRPLKSGSRPVKVQTKINTGMNRSGIHWENTLDELLGKVLGDARVKLMGTYTHLAMSGQHPFSTLQCRRFMESIEGFEPADLGLLHIAASSTAHLSEYHFDMVRVGISLYGLSDVPGIVLKPVLGLKARISQFQRIEAGDIVGYGASWKANRDSLIGVLPLGYADGVKRSLSNKIQGIIRGKRITQVGIISMDQITFDLTDLVPEAELGEVVTLLGLDGMEYIGIADWSKILNTIPYETVCDLRTRLPRVYVRKDPQS